MTHDAAEDPFTTGLTSRTFDKISPRPPTPPKESPRSKKTIDLSLAASSGNQTVQLVSSPASSRDTSPPTSSAESASRKLKKRVVWSGWTTYHKPESGPLTPSTTRVRPSASTDPKSLKSILKHTAPSPFLGSPTPGADQPFLIHTHLSFTSMLESVVQALASTERSKKLDTYFAFCNTLKAYDDVPDWNSMEKRIPILCGYIKRDLVARMEDGGNLDSQLIQQATKLLTIICWYERLVNVMDEQSTSFFIQHAIQKIEDPQTSKASVTLYLHFLSQQRFAPKSMTTEKCNRIITALETLDERVTGKSITKERIEIYHKLLSQSRTTMVARAPDWMRNAFGGLLNHIKEVRARSLSFLRDAAMVMGKEKTVTRTISNIFNQDNDGKRMFESIHNRLEHFVKKEQEGQYVSQLWAVLLLLTQSVGDKWDFFTPWLRIIETCFNVSEPEVKVEAQLAWSKLIYIANIGPNTQRKLLELMCKPVEQYLDPKNATSNTRKPRRAALSNVCVYLYYGFRPNATSKQLSEIWDIVVVGLIQNLVLTGSEAVDGCNILCSLFDGSAQKRWSEDRLLVGQAFMKIDEVPRLDPKWVRSNCERVLKTVEVALGRTSWEDNATVPGARLLWKRFTRTLADAGSKEIKIAPELMEAVSHLFNMLQRMWNNGPGISQASSNASFIERFTFLVEVALESLGTLCFTEKQLAIDEKSRFIPASTPTHKYASDSGNGLRYPPLLHIVRLFMDPPTDVPIDEQYFNCARRILAKCCASQDSRRKKLHLLASCETLLPRRDVGAVHLGLWDILAELTRGALQAPTREKALLSPSPIGGEFKDAVMVLKWGSQQHVSGWEPLFEDLTRVVQTELGEAYISTNVIAPLTESLRYSKTESNFSSSLRRTIILLEKANYTKKKPMIESIFRGHYGVPDRKPTNTDSLEGLYALTNSLLVKSYESSNQDLVSLGLDLYKAAVGFIARAPLGFIVQLEKMQEGLGVWTRDNSHLGRSKRTSSTVTHKIQTGMSAVVATKLWEKIVHVIGALPQHDNEVLLNLNILLSSGFESRRKPIVNATIKLWNATFGKQPSLNYSTRLRTALSKLKTVADISLPDFPEDDAGIHTPPEFCESQDQEETPTVGETPWSSPTPARPQLFPSLGSRISSPRKMIRETQFATRSGRSFTQADNSTPIKSKPKLRHMDSQLDYVAIEGDDPESQDSQFITEHQKEVREEQAKAAGLFPELTASVQLKSRRTMMLGSESPSMRRPVYTSVGLQKDGSSKKTEANIKEPTKMPEPMVSFVSESHMSSLPNSQASSVAGFISGSKRHPQLQEDGSSELTDLDLDNDVSISNYTPSAQIMPQNIELQVPDILSDEPYGEDNFVDAPDHFNSDNDRSSPFVVVQRTPDYKMVLPGNNADIAAAISPIANNSDYKSAEASDILHSPDAQIVAELSAIPAPDTKRHTNKRKRTASESQESLVTSSPEVLDTIVIADSEHSSVNMRPSLPTSPEPERATKRAKARKIEDTPVKTRTSTRKNKGKPGPRGPRSKAIFEGGDLDGMSLDHPVSPTPTRTRFLKVPKRTRGSQDVTPKNEQKTTDVSFIQETQISSSSLGSSVPNSQVPPGAKVGPTPIKSQQPKGLFSDDVNADELQVRSPRHSMSEYDKFESPGRPAPLIRRSNRRVSSIAAAKKPMVSVAIERRNTEKDDEQGQQEKGNGEKSEPKVAETASSVIDAVRKALRALDKTTMTASEIASIEDEVFEAFTKLREKKRALK